MSDSAPSIRSPHRQAGGRAPTAEHGAVAASQAAIVTSPAARMAWALARLALGWIFLWAFLDKLFGLGRATPSGQGWIDGGNPTEGFLQNATGPIDGLYHDIAGAGLVNVLFMAGLLGVGVALMAGITMWPAAIAGSLMLLLMWLALLPIDSNPFMDDHIVFAIVLIGLALSRAGDTWGLGQTWRRTALVQRMPWLA